MASEVNTPMLTSDGNENMMVGFSETMTFTYTLVRKAGYCGEPGDLLSNTTVDVDKCASLAYGAGASCFLKGVKFPQSPWFNERFSGVCIKCTLSAHEVSEAYSPKKLAAAEPQCKPNWYSSMFYDFY